jgi:hypothetical protein
MYGASITLTVARCVRCVVREKKNLTEQKMNKDEVIEWIYNLQLQTLTDELKDDIVEKIEELNQNKEDE